MKNVYLYILFLLIGGKSLGQGVDVVFFIDNSSSIDATEFSQISSSVNSIMQGVLDCNDYNSVTVVQFSAATGNVPRIYIESDFVTSSYTFPRRYTLGGNTPDSVDLLSDALSLIVNSSTNVTSTQKVLNKTPGNELVIYFLTDAVRYADLLENYPMGDNNAFASYTSIKNTHNAKFMLVMVPQDSSAQNAGAAVVSLGGNYSGTIESYSADPDGAGNLPRFFLPKVDFAMNSSEIQEAIDDLCFLYCPETLTLIQSADNTNSVDFRQAETILTASNIIGSASTAVYHAGDTVLLKTGFHSDSGSVFRGYIEGCSGEFEGLMVPPSEYNSLMVHEDASLFSLAPNPATESVSIKSDKVMTNITITSMQGVVLFNRDVKTNNYELNISNYIKGFYVVNVTTEDGQTETQKLIKE